MGNMRAPTSPASSCLPPSGAARSLFVRMGRSAIGPGVADELRVGLAAVAMLIYARAARFELGPGAELASLPGAGRAEHRLHWGLYAWSGKHIGRSYMAILNAAAPWFAAICGAIWLGEKLSWRKILGLALGMLGVALLVGFGPIAASPEVLLAVFACISATACYALAGVYVKKRASKVAPRALTVGRPDRRQSRRHCLSCPRPRPAAAFTWQVAVAVLGISLNMQRRGPTSSTSV